MKYSWPGNVRELRNAIQHAFVTVGGDRLTLLDLPPEIRLSSSSPAHLPSAEVLNTKGQAERTHILETLQAVQESRAEAAKRLGVSRVTLLKKMRRL